VEHNVTSILHRLYDSPVSELALERLPGDASDRAYYRAKFMIDQKCQTVIVMALKRGSNPFKSEEIELYHDDLAELPFINIQKFLGKLEIAVPQILWPDDSEGFLLLEDLGDTLLLHLAERADEEERWRLYCKAIDELMKMQVYAKPDKKCMAFTKMFNAPMFNWELDHFTEYGIEKRLQVTIFDQDRETIFNHTRKISSKLDSLPKIFCHRDYHSRNLMVFNDKIYMIDFQDALTGPAVYDLASLLRDSYIDLGGAMVEELARYYSFEMSKVKGEEINPDEVIYLTRLQAIQRNLKAAGRFGYIDIVKGNPKFLADIPRTLSYVKANLIAMPEHHELLHVYQKYVKELR